MPIPIWLEHGVDAIADTAAACWPRKAPPRPRLMSCGIVAHRGMHAHGELIENTIRAFDRAVQAGVWGIEFDVRWTRDHVPVVTHDADCRRVFQSALTVSDTEFARLRHAIPQIPTLEETVNRYGKQVHLMIELKRPSSPLLKEQHETLARLLKPLDPGDDFHLLAYETETLESVTFVPKNALLALARMDTRRKSQFVLERQYGGLLGHYALLSKRLIDRHLSAGQAVGTGFVGSRNCFFREVNRGVRWTFTNSCAELTQLRKRLVGPGP